jgi:hypothetical protein
MLQRERAQREVLQKELQELAAWRKGQEVQQEEFRHLHAQAQKQQVYGEFLGGIPQSSALRELYTDAEILAKGDWVADEYRQKTGQVATLGEVREYMEHEAQQRLARLRGQASGAQGNKAPQGKANGQRTLASSTSGERRAAPRPFDELVTPAEQRRALVEAANEALRSSS